MGRQKKKYSGNKENTAEPHAGAIQERGGERSAPVQYPQCEIESTPGRPAASATASAVASSAESPAASPRVAYRSQSAVSPPRVAPRCDSGSAPPLTRAGTRIPPSQLLNLAPRRG